ncbi:Y255 [Enterospora canceri]|uniref:Y255 n=1 Tax=Enterospora canceri TaxID=1081671 RepID=A0A1Y1S8H1_9MICR|nr:Y255 [Enterospora canceri]
MFSNRYRIARILGEGSSSTVYMGYDRESEKKVAIKCINKTHSKEIEILKRLMQNEDKNENVLIPIEIIEQDGVFYIITESCECNLVEFINTYEIEEKNIVKIIRMILIGLHFMHRNNLIHRDIKLSNLLVKNETIKICDLGLSCFMDENKNEVCGTHEYMAPEIGKDAYSAKIDIYALGVVAKTLVCRAKEMELDSACVSEELKWFINQLLATDPTNRPSAFEALQQPVFDVLYRKMHNFKIIKEFSRETKYGKIIRKENYVSIESNFNKTVVFYEECCREEEHKMHDFRLCDNFRTSIKINDKIKTKDLLSNTELKYYNFLCGYIELLADETVIHTIDGIEYKFRYFLSRNWSYEARGITVKKLSDKYEINGREMIQFPHKLHNLREYIETLVNRSEKEIIRCNKNEYTLENRSNIELGIKTDNLINNAIYIRNVGWMVRKNMILLNSGLKIELDGMTVMNKEEVNYKNDREIINKIVRLFIEEARKYN